MPDPGVNLAKECFREHVATPAFQEGVAAGRWELIEDPRVGWPHVLIWIAAPARPKGPDRWVFRFDLKDYPEKGPTAMPWDVTANAKLDPTLWPKGSGDVAMAFRTNWNGATSLYTPWDRAGMDSHSNWKTEFPGVAWKPTKTIVQYLHLTHELLATSDYHGS
jgi:hypothetical protein